MNAFFQTLYFVGSLKIFCRSKDWILGSLNPGFAQIGRYFFFFFGDFGEPTILGVLFQVCFFQRFSDRGSSFFSLRALCYLGSMLVQYFCFPNFKSPFVAIGTV